MFDLVFGFSFWWVMGGGTANGSAEKREQTKKPNETNEAEEEERSWFDEMECERIEK